MADSKRGRAAVEGAGVRDLRSQSDAPGAGSGLLLWRVGNRWRAAQRDALEPLGLTHVRLLVLTALARLEREGAITQRRLAGHAALDVMTTSQVLRVLERNGLIVRLQHPSDARAKALRTTSAGRVLARRATAAVDACDADFFAPLGDDRDAFARALQTLATAAA